MTRDEALAVAIRAIEAGAVDEAVRAYWCTTEFIAENDAKTFKKMEDYIYALTNVRFCLMSDWNDEIFSAMYQRARVL